ncbi:hypothetical protein Tco_0699417 [Tanacetum coccineum]
MSSMSEDIQCAGSDTRPPMLDRTDFESWQQRIRLSKRSVRARVLNDLSADEKERFSLARIERQKDSFERARTRFEDEKEGREEEDNKDDSTTEYAEPSSTEFAVLQVSPNSQFCKFHRTRSCALSPDSQ